MNKSLLAETLALLPPREIHESDGRWGGQYGAFTEAARYIGLEAEPPWRWGQWQHGWKHPHENVNPEWVAGSGGRTMGQLGWNHKLWVFREDQEQYVRSCGATQVRAIGSPMLYLSPPHVERIRGSLLVMPPHSIPEAETHWETDRYIAFIASLREQFSWIVACLTPACIAQGLWVSELMRIGVPVIEGAEIRDRNSLMRMAVLLSRFECVTMAIKGSQLAYAAYWGAKPSIAGPRPREYSNKTTNLSLYKTVPEALAISQRLSTPEVLQRMVGEFILEPRSAQTARGWGEWQLGLRHRLTPLELQKEFRWTSVWQAVGGLRRAGARLARHVARPRDT